MKKFAFCLILIMMVLPVFAQISTVMVDINENAQIDIGDALNAKAAQIGMPIIPEHNVYATRDDMFVAVAAVPHLDTLDPVQFEQGPVEIALLYLSTASDALFEDVDGTLAPLPTAYYRVSVKKEPGLDEATAILKDADTHIVYRFPIRILPHYPWPWPWPYPWPWVFTVCYGWYIYPWGPWFPIPRPIWFVKFDFHWIWWDIAIYLPYKYAY